MANNARRVPPNPTRASRARHSSPTQRPKPIGPELPSVFQKPRASTPTTAVAGDTGALSIFAPPPTSTLPEALQEVIGTSSSSSSSSRPANPLGTASTAGPATPANGLGDKDKNGDTLMREAGEGFESRLRSARRGFNPAIRTGVSASGKGVKVGTAAKEGGRIVKKKTKNKADVEIVRTPTSQTGHLLTWFAR